VLYFFGVYKTYTTIKCFFLTSIHNFATRSMENLTEDGCLQFYTVDQQESSFVEQQEEPTIYLSLFFYMVLCKNVVSNIFL
jgi:hypothetical protein